MNRKNGNTLPLVTPADEGILAAHQDSITRNYRKTDDDAEKELATLMRSPECWDALSDEQQEFCTALKRIRNMIRSKSPQGLRERLDAIDEIAKQALFAVWGLE